MWSGINFILMDTSTFNDYVKQAMISCPSFCISLLNEFLFLKWTFFFVKHKHLTNNSFGDARLYDAHEINVIKPDDISDFIKPCIVTSPTVLLDKKKTSRESGPTQSDALLVTHKKCNRRKVKLKKNVTWTD